MTLIINTPATFPLALFFSSTYVGPEKTLTHTLTEAISKLPSHYVPLCREGITAAIVVIEATDEQNHQAMRVRTLWWRLRTQLRMSDETGSSQINMSFPLSLSSSPHTFLYPFSLFLSLPRFLSSVYILLSLLSIFIPPCCFYLSISIPFTTLSILSLSLPLSLSQRLD